MTIDLRVVLALLRAMVSLHFSRPVDEQFLHTINKDRSVAQYYHDNIHPYLLQCEDARIAALKKMRIRGWLSIPCIYAVSLFAALLSTLITFEHPKSYGFLHIFPIGAILMTYYWSTSPMDEHVDTLKRILFPKIIAYFGKDFVYEKQGRDVTEFKSSLILPNYERLHTEDRLCGVYKGRKIEFSELSLFSENGCVFRGGYILVYLPKKFKGTTTIAPYCNWLEEYFLDDTLPDRGDFVEVPRFKKRFEVFSTQREEAQKIMNTSFPRRWLKVFKIIPKSKPSCSLYDDKILLTFSLSVNLFTPRTVFNPVGCDENVLVILEHVRDILRIVDSICDENE